MDKNNHLESPGHPAIEGAAPMINQNLKNRLNSIRLDLNRAIDKFEDDLAGNSLTGIISDQDRWKKGRHLGSWETLEKKVDEAGGTAIRMSKKGLEFGASILKGSAADTESSNNRMKYLLASGFVDEAYALGKQSMKASDEDSAKSEIAIACHTAAALLIADMLVQVYEKYRGFYGTLGSDELYIDIYNIGFAVAVANPAAERLIARLQKMGEASWSRSFDYDFVNGYNALGTWLKDIETTHALTTDYQTACRYNTKKIELRKISDNIDQLTDQRSSVNKEIDSINSTLLEISRLDRGISEFEDELQRMTSSPFKALRKKAIEKVAANLARQKESREQSINSLPRDHSEVLRELRHKHADIETNLSMLQVNYRTVESEIEALTQDVIDFKWPDYAKDKYDNRMKIINKLFM